MPNLKSQFFRRGSGRQQSLKARIQIVIGVILTILMGWASFFLIQANRNEMDSALRSRAMLVTDVLAEALTTPMWDFDEAQIHHILSSLSKDPAYVGSSVTDINNKSYIDGDASMNDHVFSIPHGIVLRVDGEEKPLGTLEVFFSGEKVEALYQQQMKQSIAAVLLLQLLIQILIYFCLRMITVPLDKLTDAMSELAQGNNDTRIPSLGRQDEIGRMARTVSVFKETAVMADHMAEQQAADQSKKEERRMMIESMAENFNTTISGILSSVSGATGNVRNTATSLTSTADDLNMRSQEAIGASNYAMRSVEVVATAAEELSTSISDISRQVTLSISAVDSAVENANKAETTVTGLTGAAQQIGSIVELIHEITEQINLLALNATIEAARAGPAGKGFAVVASEVKSLANETSNATKDISNHIESIQRFTHDTAGVIRNVTQTIRQIHEIAATIATAVSNQGKATQEIARSIQNASANNQEVSQSISSVNEAVNSTRDSASMMMNAASHLQDQFAALEHGVKTFITGIQGD